MSTKSRQTAAFAASYFNKTTQNSPSREMSADVLGKFFMPIRRGLT